MQAFETNFMGRSGFFWFFGVVEDRMDPSMLGRLRVRVLGWHTEDKTLIPTEDLFWMNVISSVQSASISGIGMSPASNFIEGTWVYGFFKDGANAQDGVICGGLTGLPEELPNSRKGFYDPRTNPSGPVQVSSRNYNTDGTGVTLQSERAQTYPRADRLNEPETNRLTRNQKIDQTIVAVKKNNLDKSVPTADGTTWDEPTTTYAAVYPYNTVNESESGHIEEIDNTPGAERTHRWNRSGTFEEIDAQGNKVTKTVKNQYDITMADSFSHVMGNANETINKNLNILVQKDLTVLVNTDGTITIKGNAVLEVDGNLTATIKGNASVEVNQNLTATVDGDINATAKGSATITASGDLTLNSSGNISISAGGVVSIQGTAIHLN